MRHAAVYDPFARRDRRTGAAAGRPAGPRHGGGLYRRAGRGQDGVLPGPWPKGSAATDPVSSPTFAIVNYYRGPRPLAHFDLYRIHSDADLAAAGFYDYLDSGAVIAAEWSENCAGTLALENPVTVDIARIDDTTRRITIGNAETLL